MKKLVYLAGPYRGDVKSNIARAQAAGAIVAEMSEDLFPIVPHSLSIGFDGMQTDAYFLDATLEVLRRCDAVFVFADPKDSQGTIDEIEEAHRLSKPVFYSEEDLAEWSRT